MLLSIIASFGAAGGRTRNNRAERARRSLAKWSDKGAVGPRWSREAATSNRRPQTARANAILLMVPWREMYHG